MDFDTYWIALGAVAGMASATIAAGTGGKGRQQIDLGEELDEIAGPHRARFHEILIGVARVTRAHEDVHDIMYMRFRLGQRQVFRRREGASET